MLRTRLFDFPGVAWRNPFAAMEQIRREMDVLNNSLIKRQDSRMLPSYVFPAINITEDGDRYYVRTELPGIKSEDLNIQVEAQSLSIAGERKIDPATETVKYHRREREAGKFSRIIGLPAEINTEKVEAKLVDGILTITIDKAEAVKPRQIAVS